MATKPLILVTGISGFLGGHIVDQLIKADYRVRGTARSSKVDLLRDSFKHHGDDLEIIGVDDIVAADWSDALNGVQGVIHAATPMAGRSATPEAGLQAAVEGNLNILRQAESKGVKTFVYMSSMAAGSNPMLSLADFPKIMNENSWNSTTKETILDPATDPFVAYGGWKAFAQKALWEFADAHPHMNITAIMPPLFYGPFSPGTPRPAKGDIPAFSTNGHIYGLLAPSGRGQYPATLAGHVDVRDAARGLVLALSTAPRENGKHKRVLLTPPKWFSWAEAVTLIAKERPALKARLVDPTTAPPRPPNPVDQSAAQEVLKFGEFIPWQTTILDAVDAVIAVEQEWARIPDAL